MWTELSNQLSYIFFNKAPTVAPSIWNQWGDDKHIVVEVNAHSNNGFPVTYSVKTPPKYGTLSFDDKTGQYTYTPNAEFVEPGISDSFTITVNNGTSAQLPGIAGFFQQLAHTHAVRLGISQPDTIDHTVNVTVTGTGVYGGDVEELSKLHTRQHYWNCLLMASAMAAAQVTGTETKPEAEVVEWAKQLDSVVLPGRKMFLSERINLGAWPKDAVVLMETHYPVTAVNTRYGTYDANGNTITAATPADGQRALNDMNAALAQGKAVTVGINNYSLYSSTNPEFNPGPDANYNNYNHQIQVLRVDAANGQIWVNDSAHQDGGEQYSLSAFMKSWQVSDYDLTVVSAIPPTES